MSEGDIERWTCPKCGPQDMVQEGRHMVCPKCQWRMSPSYMLGYYAGERSAAEKELEDEGIE
jgi:hypothetical protein